MSERARGWLIAGVALALATAAILVLRTDSRPVSPPARVPLASPVTAPGEVGGLLPDVVLGGAPARSLRPAVVFLVGEGCACVAEVRRVVAAAAPLRIVTYVVAPDATDAQRIAAQSGGQAAGFADPGGALASAYGVRANVTLVLVRRDGVVNQVVAAVAPSLRLGPALRALVA